MKKKYNLEKDGFCLYKYSHSKKFKNLCKIANKKFSLSSKNDFLKKWTTRSGDPKLLLLPHKKINEFERILKSKPILKIIENNFEKIPLAVIDSKISIKKFSTNQKWFAHQDSAYDTDKFRKGLTFVVYLENNFKRNGNINCYKKSHLYHLRHKIVFLKNETEPQIKCDISKFQSKEIIGKQGDILVMKNSTAHSSKNNFIKNSIRPLFIFTVVKIKKEIILDDEFDKCFTYNKFKYPNFLILHKLFFKYSVFKTNMMKKILYYLFKFRFVKELQI